MMRMTLAIMVAMVCGFALAEETALKVMSFNVRCAPANDGPNSWEFRKEILADTIRQYAPDVLGLQECFKNQADFIAQALPEYRWFGVGREADGGGEMMAIFYRPGTLTPLESGHFWLSETPEVPGSKSWNTSCTRMVSWARFRHGKTGAVFHYMNTHFDHRSEPARVESARLVLDRTKAIDPKIPVILTGDFNAAAEEAEAWKILTQGGFHDTWLVAEKKVGPEITFGGFKAPPENFGKERIDWILFRGDFKVQQAETILYNKEGRYPSDHYPVCVSLSFTSEATPK